MEPQRSENMEENTAGKDKSLQAATAGAQSQHTFPCPGGGEKIQASPTQKPSRSRFLLSRLLLFKKKTDQIELSSVFFFLWVLGWAAAESVGRADAVSVVWLGLRACCALPDTLLQFLRLPF